MQLVLVQPSDRELLGQLVRTQVPFLVGEPDVDHPAPGRDLPRLLTGRRGKPDQIARFHRPPLRHPPHLTLVPSSVPDAPKGVF
jgi:hypothetical protein